MEKTSLRILLTSDMHCTDLMTWYGVSDADRQQAWVDTVLAEHQKQPFDAIIIAGDISLDYSSDLERRSRWPIVPKVPHSRRRGGNFRAPWV